jgi:hypothetical protein
LPLENVLEASPVTTLMLYQLARSAIEGRNTALPLEHTQAVKAAGKLGALMFFGTATEGPYGEWTDLHTPFAPFCPESLLTVKVLKNYLCG